MSYLTNHLLTSSPPALDVERLLYDPNAKQRLGHVEDLQSPGHKPLEQI